MNTSLIIPTFPLKLKKRILDIMDRDKCSLISAEQTLLCELLKEIKKKNK